MKTTYEPKLKAHVSVDDDGKVRNIRHNQEFWESAEDVPSASAESYLTQWADALQIPQEQLQNLGKQVVFDDPREQGVEYQQFEEKTIFDSTTVGYYQTYHNTPVWRKGLSVKIKQGPNRVVASTNNSEDNLEGSLPRKGTIDNYKKIFGQVAVNKVAKNVGMDEAAVPDEAGALIGDAIGLGAQNEEGAALPGSIETLSSKFFMYKYDPEKRYAGRPSPDKKAPEGTGAEEVEIPLLDIPPVSDKIKPGQTYLVAEMIFEYNPPGFYGLVWLILMETETRSILYIECMTQGINGSVFRLDPNVKTGNLAITSAGNNAALNPHRDVVVLTDLNAPVGGVQSLIGTYARITEEEAPVVASPTKPAATDFTFNVRTNDFGAVNAYYHQTQLIKTIESLGFPRAVYFDGTTFPLRVDHRGMGNAINAHWAPNGTGGTAHQCYALGDVTDLANPLCRSVDPWVHWHEMGGHGTLGDHVGGGTLGFSHSAGDGLAAIQMDPESALRGVPERFKYAPFRPALDRRFDRPVATWAWRGGINDDGGYGSEQILATCHFRIYRSIGGDSSILARRIFASRVATYLILRTIGVLTPATNPNTPEGWCEEMRSVDLENWTTEGLAGGAYNKVIRWAFEKQGAFQPAGAPTPVTTPGAPPNIDVYIDDGRHGEYEYQATHWNNQSIWNRQANDGLPGHQNARDNNKNFLYGKVKNRGTKKATKVNVRAFHTLPGAGLTWPTDFVELNPVGGLTIPAIGANNSQEVQVGPFTWEPNINAFGHDCVLMVVSAAGDPSNIDNFTGAETIQEWRLVPNDNNIAQRNINVIPGGSGIKGLLAGLNGVFFMASNNLTKLATMTLKVEIPRVLKAKGLKVGFKGLPRNTFRLKSGEKQKVELEVTGAEDFKPEELKASKDQTITISVFANDILMGGMSYFIDPGLKRRTGGAGI